MGDIDGRAMKRAEIRDRPCACDEPDSGQSVGDEFCHVVGAVAAHGDAAENDAVAVDIGSSGDVVDGRKYRLISAFVVPTMARVDFQRRRGGRHRENEIAIVQCAFQTAGDIRLRGGFLRRRTAAVQEDEQTGGLVHIQLRRNIIVDPPFVSAGSWRVP